MTATEASQEAWQWVPGTQLVLKTSFGEVQCALTTHPPPPRPLASLPHHHYCRGLMVHVLALLEQLNLRRSWLARFSATMLWGQVSSCSDSRGTRRSRATSA